MNTDENWTEDEAVENTESGSQFGARAAFIDGIVDADFLEMVIITYRHHLHAKRAEDITGRVVLPELYRPQEHIQAALEAALTDMFKVLGFREPFAERIAKLETEFYEIGKANEEALRSENRRTASLLQEEMERRRLMQERIKAEIAKLDETLLNIMHSQVTHAERRGQIALLREQLRRAENAMRFAASDIPF